MGCGPPANRRLLLTFQTMTCEPVMTAKAIRCRAFPVSAALPVVYT
jgi:hypothetical protein